MCVGGFCPARARSSALRLNLGFIMGFFWPWLRCTMCDVSFCVLPVPYPWICPTWTSILASRMFTSGRQEMAGSPFPGICPAYILRDECIASSRSCDVPCAARCCGPVVKTTGHGRTHYVVPTAWCVIDDVACRFMIT